MDRERLREIAGRLREMDEFARYNYIGLYVNVEDDDYEMDLGQFGYSTTTVSIERDEYEFDAREVLDRFPIETNDFVDLADELEQFADEEPEQKEATLDDVLARLETNGGAPLAKALRAVAEAFDIATAVPSALATTTGPLPARPLPWPGALRTDIDYTATDFPLRYQPPPGWNWANNNASSPNRAGVEAIASAATEVFEKSNGGRGWMILDKRGRVSWSKRADDDLSSGVRWGLWTGTRDGLPEGNLSFNSEDPPMALNEDGLVIREAGVNDSGPRAELGWNWNRTNQFAAIERVRAIRAEFQQDGAPLGYDPVTVPVATEEIGADTGELRLGDDVIGPDFGRLLKAERDGDYVVLTMNRDGKINTARDRFDISWPILPVIPPTGTREQLPPAYTLNTTAPVNYDPLTVPIVSGSSEVPGTELRLGDDVLGNTFGRVVGIEGENLVLDRDGKRRTIRADRTAWSVCVIDVADRNSVPTAVALGTAPPPVAVS